MTRFIIDAQLPPALARWLAANGCQAAHVGDNGMQAASDMAIWDRALQENAVIITKNEDFARRKVLARAGPAIVWIRLPNTRRRELLSWFARALPVILSALDRGETLIELT